MRSAPFGNRNVPTKAEARRRHGESNVTGRQVATKEYMAWNGAKSRCTNPRNARWPYYGGRGITMCERWLHSYESFLADMGRCPPGLSLDRRENDGHYDPDNCRWASKSEQMKNRRRWTQPRNANCRYRTLDGQRISVKEMANYLAITPGSLDYRLKHNHKESR
jgi:hypothetical protein